MQEDKSRAHAKWLQHYRFRWHEAVLKDSTVRANRNALALAGHIMHRYVASKGYAQFSAASASKTMGIPLRSIRRAARLLRNLGWIVPLIEDGSSGNGWGAAKYRLSGGPNDLLFDANDDDADVTGDAVT